MKSRVEIKAEARELIRTGKASPVLASAIVVVIIFVLNGISMLLTPAVSLTEEVLYPGDYEAIIRQSIGSTVTTSFFSILSSLVTTVLYAGYYLYCMGIRRGEETPYSTLLSGLGIAGRVIWCSILLVIRQILWSMLFTIPTLLVSLPLIALSDETIFLVPLLSIVFVVLPLVVISYRYHFTMYNVISDSQLSASQAIALSCRQTKGMKWTLFVKDLSFLGWQLLSLLTMSILDVWLLPYVTLTDLAYYEESRRRLMGGEEEAKYQGPEF